MATQAEELFYDATSQYGDRPDPAYSKTTLGLFMNQFREIAKTSLPPHVYFNYIGSSEVNAAAIVYKGYEFIGINFGTVLVTFDLFFTLLSFELFAPDIGKVKKNTEVLNDILYKIRFAQSPINQTTMPHWFNNIPDDPKRLAYAYALSFCALDFILQHELAHLEMGHLEYLTGTKSNFELFERRVHDDKLWQRDVSQACEVDADRASVGICLNRIHKIQSFDPNGSLFDILHDKDYCYRVWHTATEILLFVFGLESIELGDSADGSHPHPYIRSLLNQHTGLRVIRENSPNHLDIFIEGFKKANSDILSFWKMLDGCKLANRYVGTPEELDSIWTGLHTRIRPVWKDLIAAARQRKKRVYGYS